MRETFAYFGSFSPLRRLPNHHDMAKRCSRPALADYKKYCGEYGIETAALRNCMDKNGHSLTKTCVRALIDAGEVSQAEVNRRKRSGN